MMQKIIDEVVKAYQNYDGHTEIIRGIKLAMAVSGLEWTEQEYHRIVDAVMYQLAEIRGGVL